MQRMRPPRKRSRVRMRLIVSVLRSPSRCSICRWGICSAGRCPGFLLGPATNMHGVRRSRSCCCSLPVVFVNFKFFRVGFKTLCPRRAEHGLAHRARLRGGHGIRRCTRMYRIGCGHGAMGDVRRGACGRLWTCTSRAAAMILTLITLGKYFEARAKGRTTDAIATLMDLAPKDGRARIRRRHPGADPGRRRARGRRVGGARGGEGVPVDGVVVAGAASVDESAITGESGAGRQARLATPVTGATVSQSRAGSPCGPTRVGADTTLAGIIRLVDEATSSTKAPIEKIADQHKPACSCPSSSSSRLCTFARMDGAGGGCARVGAARTPSRCS